MQKQFFFLFLAGFLTTSVAAEDRIIHDFEQPLLFTYHGFEGRVGHTGSEIHIKTSDSRGGGGVNLEFDASGQSSWVPVIRIRKEASHRAVALRLQLSDKGEGKETYTFDLGETPVGKWTVLAARGAPELATSSINLKEVFQIQVMGEWSDSPIDLKIDWVGLRKPNADLIAERTAMAESIAAEEEQKQTHSAREQRTLEALLSEGADHPADGAKVHHVSFLGPRRIGLEIHDREIETPRPSPYEPRDGDVRKEMGKKPYLAWSGGRPAEVAPGVKIERKGKSLGVLVESAGTVWRESVVGTALDLTAIDEPRAYRVISSSGKEWIPTSVSRKSKPRGVAMEGENFTGHHFVYLELPEPLVEGETYRIGLHAVNTREAQVEVVYDSMAQRCEAIHVTHIGFRPDDPFKRAYLSLWTGTGGGVEFEAGEFHLIDNNNEIVFSGSIIKGIDQSEEEPFSNRKNHTQATVSWLDFSSFEKTGIYRVSVPGLGTSHPFPIDDQVWEKAFKTSLLGLLNHRSGIELGPPFTSYKRPRAFHPDDGMKIYQLDVSVWDGEVDAVDESFRRLLGEEFDPSHLTEVTEAWGGYMDAGDWDRRTQHLAVTLSQLELFEMAPEYFEKLPLSLPPSESDNDIPDLLDEALWNVDFFKRLQQTDGGVRGGVESTEHPRPGECSWQESLLVGVFAADPQTSFTYAAAAAMIGRNLKRGDLIASAEAAWNWGRENEESALAALQSRKPDRVEKAKKSTASARARAAVELFRTTGKVNYHDSFDPKHLDDVVIASAYAFLPESVAHAEWREKALATLRYQAESCVKFAELNGFNLSMANHQYIPMMGYTSIWSVPGSAAPNPLVRAHFHLKDDRYLAALVGSALYSAGANPMNMAYTTEIGPKESQPQRPLHLDYRRSGQSVPAGITVYGQSDPATNYGFDKFAHQWFLNRFGGVDSKKWPSAEAYVDLGNWPAMNEYTVAQNLGPTAFVWGYLAAR